MFPKNGAGYDVKINNFNIDEDYPTFDKYPIEIEFGDTARSDYRTMFVDQYGFGDEYSADFYLTHSGGGPIRYRSYEYIGTIELSPGFEPFSEEYSNVENEDGSTTVKEDSFSIDYNDGTRKVSCKTSPDSDLTVKEFEIGK